MLDQEERKHGDLLLEERPSDAPAATSDERSERPARAPAGDERAEVSARMAINQPGWSAQVKSWSSAPAETATLTMPDAARLQGMIAARVRTTAAPRQPFPPLPEAEAGEVVGPTLEPAAEATPVPPVAEAEAPPAPAPAVEEATAASLEPAAETASPYLAAARRAAEAARERSARIRTTSPAPLPPQPLQQLQPASQPPARREPGWLERGVSVDRAAAISHIGFRPLTGSDRGKRWGTQYKPVEPQPPAVAAARMVSATRTGNALAREERFRRLAREIEAQQRHSGAEEPLSHAQPDEGAGTGLWRRWSRRLGGGA